jgi:hypothetical protein
MNLLRLFSVFHTLLHRINNLIAEEHDRTLHVYYQSHSQKLTVELFPKIKKKKKRFELDTLTMNNYDY